MTDIREQAWEALVHLHVWEEDDISPTLSGIMSSDDIYRIVDTLMPILDSQDALIQLQEERKWDGEVIKMFNERHTEQTLENARLKKIAEAAQAAYEQWEQDQNKDQYHEALSKLWAALGHE